jgi:hypothetical protein
MLVAPVLALSFSPGRDIDTAQRSFSGSSLRADDWRGARIPRSAQAEGVRAAPACGAALRRSRGLGGWIDEDSSRAQTWPSRHARELDMSVRARRGKTRNPFRRPVAGELLRELSARSRTAGSHLMLQASRFPRDRSGFAPSRRRWLRARRRRALAAARPGRGGEGRDVRVAGWRIGNGRKVCSPAYTPK